MAGDFSDAANRVVAAAEEEARTLRHDHVGTEHLLLGVLSLPDEVGARALAALGLELAAARAQVMRAVGLPEEPSPPQLPVTPPARDALAGALREAIDLGRTTVGPEHVLLALLRERDGVAMRVLLGAGVDPRRLRDEVRALSEAATAAAARPAAPDGATAPAPAQGGAAGAYALLGVLAEGGPAAALLRAHGVDEAAVSALLESGAGQTV
ncbi:MAG: ATP-dependent Clp protease ATP-binding subunit ClpC [Solirubrobacteraceae bacterium]|nr:ATP-dependent Clp protease ATP-binding subunit ClpC [Solirubrobacteraceae bacterium]